ncbi:DUF551 domain-containing protein [Methyloceanibacter caenitepidi]|uniref:DUF551 domain-containing protein n=1 Tax=Methyloceanibacter caenitepidi TaxID=1384459 RepID=UPI003CC7AB93
MESAPKDGTHVILAVSGAYTSKQIVGEAYFNSEDHEEDGDWWWAGTSSGDYYAQSFKEAAWTPTHWMPLPNPPSKAAQR